MVRSECDSLFGRKFKLQLNSFNFGSKLKIRGGVCLNISATIIYLFWQKGGRGLSLPHPSVPTPVNRGSMQLDSSSRKPYLELVDRQACAL